jgi:peptidyl-prolyl cis-trans isomerase D
MLQSIRDHTQGWIAGTIVTVLILSFALWGIHSYFGGNGDTNIVAKVNGEPITKSQLAIAYERLRRQASQPTPNESIEKIELNLKKQALQDLINIQVLSQASVKQNYRISAQQVDNFLENVPDFQINGEFSQARFQQILAAALISPLEFFQVVKNNLLIDQPRLGMIFTSFALPDEITHTFSLISQERKIQYALLLDNAIPVESIVVTSAQIQDYYKQHEDQFKTPEQVSVQYLELSLKQLMNNIQPTDAELKSFYNEDAAAYSLTSAVQPFEKVKDKVSTAYIHQKAEELFSDLKEKLANSSYEHPDTLEITAKLLSLPIKKSTLFAQTLGGTDELTANAKVREISFSNEVLNQGNNSDVITLNPETIVVLRIDTHHPATLIPLEAVQNKIIQQLKNLAASKQTAELALEIVKKIKEGLPLAKATQDYNLHWNKAGFVGRHSDKIDSAILDAAFSLPQPSSGKGYVVSAKMPNGYVLIILDGVRDGNLSDTDKNQYKVFAEQVQNSQGLLEYELYKQSEIMRAQVSILS